jgi:hypothetical protein
LSIRDHTSRHKGIAPPERPYRKAIAVSVVAVLLLVAFFLLARKEKSTGWLAFKQIRATSDEGFLYLLLETEGQGTPDWKRIRYRIAIDTHDPKRGERMLPKPFSAEIATGAEFLIDLGGPGESSMRVTPSYNPYPLKGRTEEGGWIVSPPRSSGRFVPMTFEANRERFARDGRRFAARYLDRGALVFVSGPGDLGNPHATVAAGENGSIEIRIPWPLLNVSDPSTLRVLSGEMRPEGSESLETDGFRIYAYSFDAKRSEHPLVDRLPVAGQRAPLYTWKGWEEPKYRLELKESARAISGTMKQLTEVAAH